VRREEARPRDLLVVDVRIKPKRKKFRMASDPFAIVRVKSSAGMRHQKTKNEWLGLRGL
jgi:hypothetical protein